MNGRLILRHDGIRDALNVQEVSGSVDECLHKFMMDVTVDRFDYGRSDAYVKGPGHYPWVYIVKHSNKFTIWGYDFIYKKITFAELCDIVALTV